MWLVLKQHPQIVLAVTSAISINVIVFSMLSVNMLLQPVKYWHSTLYNLGAEA